MTIELRELAADQWDLFFGKLERAFGGPADPPEERDQWRAVTEFERTVTAWDGDELIGTAGAFSFRMTVPGGAPLGVPGVTMVSVQPTHRRRGVLTSMMRRQLDDFRGRGEPLAVLTASEPAIYGRFGYGIASHQLRGSVDTTRVRLSAPEGAAGVRVRLAEPAQAREACEAVYARLVPTRPGMMARQPGWDAQPLLDPPGSPRGRGAAAVRPRGGGRRGTRVRALLGQRRVEPGGSGRHRQRAGRRGTRPGGVRGAVALPGLRSTSPRSSASTTGRWTTR